MNTAIEYISAGIILSLILGVTGQYVTNMVSDRVSNLEQMSGLKIADKEVDQLLLSPGNPPNWGHSSIVPENIGFGLENAIKPYKIDREKILSLSNSSDNYIPIYEVRDLLGLSPNYFISIEIYPMYSISIAPLTNNKFLITVTNQWNIPVSTVNVTGAYTNSTDLNAVKINSFISGNVDDYVVKRNLTNNLGQCILDFSDIGSMKTLVVLANQLNIKSVNTWPDKIDDVVYSINSAMGSNMDFTVEIVYRNIEIDEMNYFCKLIMWWS